MVLWKMGHIAVFIFKSPTNPESLYDEATTYIQTKRLPFRKGEVRKRG